MLGGTADSEDEVVDALGEICNMIAGNFGSGEAGMKSTSQAAFDRIATILRRGDYRLRIEGHTDDTPIHNVRFLSNWELSAARATEIVRLLIVRDGFPPERLSAAVYAEYHPVASNRTIMGRRHEPACGYCYFGARCGGTPVRLQMVRKVRASRQAVTCRQNSHALWDCRVRAR